MTKKTYLKSLALTVLSLGMLAGSASAAYITGDINFGGSWEPVTQNLPDPTTVSSDILNATGIVWNPGGDGVLPPHVTSASGDFLPLLGANAVFADFFFAPSLDITNPLWTAGIFNFNLTSVSIDTQTTTTLGLNGAGIMQGTGFQDTDYSWNFSGQEGLSFSAGNSPVPEPATMLLFGTGLVGLAGVSRRSRKKAQK